MYQIIGSDGKEYGPYGAEQIHDWLLEGRLTAATQVRVAGGATWKSIDAFPGFAEVLKRRATAPANGPAPAGRTSGLAIASLVLGILGLPTLGLLGLGALVGLVLGIVAMVKIRRSGGALRGSGLALSGTILCGIGGLMILLVVPAANFFFAMNRAQGQGQSIQCMNNLKQLALGLVMYANDNQHLPSGETWCDATLKYTTTDKPFRCRLGEPGRRSHYAFNARLAGLELSQIKVPAQTVLAFETAGGWNVSGGPELLLSLPRHHGTIGVAFADGHVEMVLQPRLKTLRWEP